MILMISPVKVPTKPLPGMVSIFTLIFLTFIAPGCKKDEGQGGTGSIYGSIVEEIYNDDYSILLDSEPAIDEEVFILYGYDRVVGDRTITGLAGEFRFDYLFPGRYVIYFMSQDSTSLLDEEKVTLRHIYLERGEDRDLGTISKLSTLDYDDGAAVIKGVVRVINYVDESRWPNLVREYEDFAHEQEVYLTYGNHTFYDERTRTQHDGSFEFRNLIPGKYLVVLYSEDVTRVVEHVVLKYEVAVDRFDQVVDLGTITIEEN